MKIEIGKKYRLSTYREGNFVLVLAIHKDYIWVESQNGIVSTHDIGINWLPYTEAEPVKVWKTFAVQTKGSHHRTLIQFESLKKAAEFFNHGDFDITEITSL